MRALSSQSARHLIASALFGAVVLASGAARAGDSAYGTVTEVRGPTRVLFEVGETRYQVEIVGIVVPPEGPFADEAKKVLADLVLKQHARFRFDHRTADDVMVARLFTDNQKVGIREVGVELVRLGLARRQANYDEKYGELAAAEREAQRAGRGIWGTPKP